MGESIKYFNEETEGAYDNDLYTLVIGIAIYLFTFFFTLCLFQSFMIVQKDTQDKPLHTHIYTLPSSTYLDILSVGRFQELKKILNVEGFVDLRL